MDYAAGFSLMDASFNADFPPNTSVCVHMYLFSVSC